MTQNEALDILKMGHSCFLTGAAGTGKTYVLNEYIKYLKLHNINPSITASTGIAATHIGGQTVHSWSGIGILEKLDAYTLDKIEQNEKLFKRLNSAKILIIDEISMLHASRLDMMNTILKRNKKNSLPFGGMQIIFCGDFFQLPPVSRGERENDGKDFAYNSKAWEELNPVILYLTENYRQEDNVLNQILNDIRSEKNLEDIYEKLYSIIKKDNFEEEFVIDYENISKSVNENAEKEIIKLYTHNLDVDNINLKKYNTLSKKEKEYTYEMTSSGKAHLVETLKSSCLAPEILNLKVGTKVIFVRNDLEKKYQNGTLAEIVSFDITNMPIVKTFSGEEFSVQMENWSHTNEDGKILAEISQIPLRYAWAITIHKSQGMTLDAAEIDLSKAFGSGMGYVALSRVRKFENINLIGLHDEALKMSPDVVRQDKIFQEKSDRAKKSLEKYYEENGKRKKSLIKKQEDFILFCDGEIEAISEKELENIKEKEKIEKEERKKLNEKKKINHRKNEFGEKIKTHIITRDYIREKKSLEEIANIREIKISTIAGHIGELLEARELNDDDKIFIKEDIKNYLNKKLSKKEIEIIKNELEKENYYVTKAWKEKMFDKHKFNFDYDVLNLLKIEI